MKTKKIILTLVCSFAFLFAMAMFASAVEFSTDFGEITTVDGMSLGRYAYNDEAQTQISRVTLKNADGSYVTYPSSYVLNYNGTELRDNGVNLTNLNDNLGTDYTKQDIVLIEIPYGTTRINNCLGSNTAANAASSVEKMILPESLTMIGEIAFVNMVSLKEVYIPASTTTILKQAFMTCTNLKKVTFAEDCKVTSIPNSVFENCSSLEEVYFSDDITYLGYGVLSFCPSLKTVKLPNKLSEMGQYVFNKSNLTSDFTLVLPESYTVVGLQTFNTMGSPNIVFLGKMTNANPYNWDGAKFYFANNTPDEIMSTVVNTNNNYRAYFCTTGEIYNRYGEKVGDMALSDHLRDAGTVLDATCTENEKTTYKCICCGTVIETVEKENSALGHDWKVTQTIDATCTAAKTVNYVCNRCNETKSETEGSALGHDFAGGSVTAITYEDFTLNGTKTTKCSRCDVTEDSSLAPIFTVLGYSKSETDGVIGLKAGYAVDFDALKVYEDFNNVTVEYGMKLANAKYASEISNDASENVFNADLTESDYNRFNTTIVGFKDTDAHKNLSLIMLAYAKCDGKVQYIQAETSSGEVDGFKTITIATVETAIEAQPAVVVAKED